MKESIFTTDFVVGTLLGLTLFASLFVGNVGTELQTNLCVGLVGFLGRNALATKNGKEGNNGKGNLDERTIDDSNKQP